MAIRLDLSDDGEVARLRAGVMTAYAWAACAFAIVVQVVAPHATEPIPAPVFRSLLGSVAVVGLATGLLGRRLGDRAFVALNVATAGCAAVALSYLGTNGSPVAWELFLVPTMAVIAVFAPRRRHALGGAETVVLMIALLAWYRLRMAPSSVVGAALEAFAATLTVLTFRMLRELAERALADAHRGEVTDPLTGLVNRRGLDRFGPDRWRVAARTGGTVAVIVVDVDHFKAVNDTQGHAAGDDLLRRLGDVLTRNTRPEDVVVRLGGEEFAVLAPVRPGEGVQVAERLRVTVGVELAPVTVSVGVTEAASDEEDGLPEAMWRRLDEADRALYRAKSAGRNRVVSAS